VARETEPAGIVVRLPGPLQPHANGADELNLTATTVGELLDAIAEHHPTLVDTIAPDGVVAGAFLIALGEGDIRNLDGLATRVRAGDTVRW
jgi:ferredoxin-nitrite reductase